MEVSTPIEHRNLPLLKELVVTTEQDAAAAAGWAHSQSGHVREEKSLLLLSGFECWIVQSLKSLSFLS
jgi:hypothetical protein